MGLGVITTRSMGDVPGTAKLEDLDAANFIAASYDNIKYAEDGKTILVPQPSDDPNDPLNFPLWRRDLITAVLCAMSLIASTLSPLLAANSLSLSLIFDTNFTNIALLTGYHLMGVAVSGFFFVASARVWGKRHLYLLGAVIIIISSIWGGAGGVHYNSLVAARVFQGVGLAPFEALVNDSVAEMYYVHQRGVRMAFSNLSLFGGAFFTPVIVGKMTFTLGWQWTFYFIAIFTAVILPFIYFFVPETQFRRELPPPATARTAQTQDSPPSSELKNLSATSLADKGTDAIEPSSDAQNVEGEAASGRSLIEKDEPKEPGLHTPYKPPPPQGMFSKEALALFHGRFSDEPYWKLLLRPLPLFLHPGFLWAVLIQGAIIGWTVMIGITIAVILFGPPLFFNEVQTGYMYAGAFIGALLGFAVAGLLADTVPKWMARRNNGVFEPEFRTILVIPMLIFAGAGLYGFGYVTIDAFKYRWFWPDFFFALEVMGMVLGATASALYIADAHEDMTIEGYTCLLIFKNIFSFALTFKGLEWIQHVGVKPIFIIMGSVQVGICCLTIPLYLFGKMNRAFFAKHDLLRIFGLRN